jgi:hypothetical protein
LWPQFYFNDDTPGRYYHQEFPDVYCWSMPHMIHVAVSTIGLLLFTLMAGMFTLAEMGGCCILPRLSSHGIELPRPWVLSNTACVSAELNPLSHNYLAMAHSK